jgi:sugar lactone lactonase YvrE
MNINSLETNKLLVGESPIWHADEQALYFCDVLGQRVLRFAAASGETTAWSMPTKIGSLALRAGGGAIVALVDGIYDLDLASGALRTRARPSPMHSDLIFNDGKIDRRGRFFVGTADLQALKPEHGERRTLAGIYRIDADGSWHKVVGNFAVCNGPCWSPNDQTFYIADSVRQLIYAYDFDIDTGAISNGRPFVDTSAFGGQPDGATIDAEGNLWSAIAHGGKIICVAPGGEIQRVISMPVHMPSSVTFGGPRLDRLFVTSIDAETLLGVHDPAGGTTFVIDGLDAQGIAEPRYGG